MTQISDCIELIKEPESGRQRHLTAAEKHRPATEGIAPEIHFSHVIVCLTLVLLSLAYSAFAGSSQTFLLSESYRQGLLASIRDLNRQTLIAAMEENELSPWITAHNEATLKGLQDPDRTNLREIL